MNNTIKATIERIKTVTPDGDFDQVRVKDLIVYPRPGAYKADELCIVIIKEINGSTSVNLEPLSILDGPNEMVVGISQQPWGNQLQLGPYDNALVIEEGIDVTSYVLHKIFND